VNVLPPSFEYVTVQLVSPEDVSVKAAEPILHQVRAGIVWLTTTCCALLLPLFV
jgi:hypothetical protein